MGWKLYVLVTFVSSVILLGVYDHYMRCNHSHINKLCAEVRQGRITGPLCNDLCQEKTITFDKCVTSDYAKQVYQGTVRGKNVILKLVTHWLSEFNVKKHLDGIADGSAPQYKSLIFDAVISKFGDCIQCKELSETFVSMADVNQDGHLTEAEAESMLAVLTQHEPAMLMALNGSKHSVDFVGYCGGMYAVDQMPLLVGDFFGVWRMEDLSLLLIWCDPVQDFMRELVLRVLKVLRLLPYVADVLDFILLNLRSLAQVRASPTIEEMFIFVFQFMDMTLELSSKPFGILQSCDIHVWNYGVTNNLTVKVIDLDLTFSKPMLSRILSQKSCLSHEDCIVGTFEECMSPCDTDTGFCSPQPHSNDLQNFCSTFLPYVLEIPDRTGMHSQIVDCLNRGFARAASSCMHLPHANSTGELSAHVKLVKVALEKVKQNCMNIPNDHIAEKPN